MTRKPLLIAIVGLAFASIACGISIDLPVDRIVTGPVQTEQILIEPPDFEEVNLGMNFGAGKLQIRPGEGAALVNGTAEYNAPDLKPIIKVEGSEVQISTGDLKIEGIPNLGNELENNWDLELGSQLMNLKINAGAYDGDLDLGGLALKTLDVVDGAANTHLRFSAPNLVEMVSLRYQTGASNVQLSGLANANFSTMIFRSGAGDYRLDFSGDLKRDGVVTIELGFSQVALSFPEERSVKVITSGKMMDVEASSKWEKEGNIYVLGGGGPTLTITVDLGAGKLILEAN